MTIGSHAQHLTDTRTVLDEDQWVLEYSPLQAPKYSGLATGGERAMLKLRTELRDSGVEQIRFAHQSRLNAKGQLPLLPHSIKIRKPAARDVMSIVSDYLDWATDKELKTVHLFPVPTLPSGSLNTRTLQSKVWEHFNGRGFQVKFVDPADYIGAK